MAKIAAELRDALERRRALGEPGGTSATLLARGEGWTAADVICTSGPQDRRFEEQHSGYSVAIVLSGTFQYSSQTGSAMMSPGSLLLGNRGQCFECGHEHAEGDRCLSFWFDPEYFERLRADAGEGGSGAHFRVPRIPALPSLTPMVAAAAASLSGARAGAWEEIGIGLAAHAIRLADGISDTWRAPKDAEARVTRTVRAIEAHPDAPHTLGNLARRAGLSPYHFLRTFERVTGVTPHQYVLRLRLREAALRLAADPDPIKIVEIAFDAGFGDVSNFNRAFRAEFGMSPRAYRQRSD